jgi:hypothetical protein
LIEKGPATTEEVIGAFLRAEIDSSRYSLCINQTLTLLGCTSQIIYSPDPTNNNENDVRRMVLAGDIRIVSCIKVFQAMLLGGAFS